MNQTNVSGRGKLFPEVVDFDTVKDLSAIKCFLLTGVILN
jgi:hypothetical protein